VKVPEIITIALITLILINPLSIGKTTWVNIPFSQQSLSNSPKANFTYSPTNPVVNQPVNFTDQSVGNITSREWNFGDGTPQISNVTAPTHEYVESGYYTVTLTVADQENYIPVSASLYVRKINTSLLLDSPTFPYGGNEATLTATLTDEYGNRAPPALQISFYVNDSRGDNIPIEVGYTDGIGRAVITYVANSSGLIKAVFNGTTVYAGTVSNVQAIGVGFNIIPYAALASAAVVVMSVGLAYLRWRSRKTAMVEKESSEDEEKE
jgi:PKD repeat protein